MWKRPQLGPLGPNPMSGIYTWGPWGQTDFFPREPQPGPLGPFRETALTLGPLGPDPVSGFHKKKSRDDKSLTKV